MEVGPKRDIVGELSKAVRDQGLKMGLYYSLMEWESTPVGTKDGSIKYYLPDEIISKYKIPADKMISDHIIPQMKDLVQRYQPSIIYPDGDWDEDDTRLQSKEFLSWLYNHAPNKDEVVVNDRWGKVRGKHGGYYTREYSDINLDTDHPWEEVQGMGYSFGYNRDEDINDYRSSEELVHLLVNTVGLGGNLCLNVGPRADGKMPGIMEQRLKDIGAWLAINGEGIYGTKAWKNPAERKKEQSDKSPQQTENQSAAEAASTKLDRKIFYTIKGDDLFVLTTQWPTGGILVDGLLFPKNTRVELLGSKKDVTLLNKSNAVLIKTPVVSPADFTGKYAFVFKVYGGAKAIKN